MTTHDLELQRWMNDWQGAELPATPPAAIRDYVRRRSRLLALWIATEVIVGVGGLAFIIYTVFAITDRVHRVLMVLLALGVAAALAFSWWNWRGTLHVSTEDTATFMTLSMERLRRVRRALRMSWLLLAAQVAVFTPWIAYRLYVREVAPTIGQQAFAWGLLFGLSASAAVWTLLAGRWANHDARVLDGLAQELSDEAIR